MTDQPPAQDDGAGGPDQPNWRRELEARAAAGDEAVAKLAELERREVFRDAGIDPKAGVNAYFVKGYEGELTAEAIQAEAQKIGLGAEAPPPPVGDTATEDRIAAAAAAGAGPTYEPTLDDRIRATTSEDELRELVESEGMGWNTAT